MAPGETSTVARPSTVSLRPAVEADAGTIRSMVRRARLNPLGLDWHRFLVATGPGDEIIGCVQVKPHGAEIVELASLVVLPARRHQGVARALIQQLQELHAPPLWLMCRAELIGFYEMHDFQWVHDVAMLPDYFRRIRRLVGLFDRLTPTENRLAIMVWEGTGQSVVGSEAI